MLNALKAANPCLNIIRPADAAFRPYGTFLGSDDWQGIARRSASVIPAGEEPAYIASVDELETPPLPKSVDAVFHGEEVQVGICRGFNRSMNGMEWHDCPEIIVASTPMVLLLGLKVHIQNGKWDSARTEACLLEPGEAVALNAETLHFAPARVNDEPFLCLIILARGVNEPLDQPDSTDPALRMRRKWLLVHPDSPQAGQGALVGITGENITVHSM